MTMRTPTNACQWSNDIKFPPYFPLDCDAVGGNPDPAGGNTAWLLTATADLAALYASFITATEINYCVSVYVKKVSTTNFYLALWNNTKGNYDARAGYDLDTYAITPMGGLTISGYGIQVLPNGWVRPWLTAAVGYGSMAGLVILLTEGDSHYVYNFQLNKGTSPDDALITQEVQRS